MKNTSLLLSLTILTLSLFGQDRSLKNYDHVYKHNIKSVKFHLNGAFLSIPIVNLQSSARLVLSFDDMNEDVTDYTYTIAHCNQDWKPSDLEEMDYMDGFNGERINDYDFSFNTLTDYTHYDLLLPNDDIRWLVSGNYIVHVFSDDEDQEPVITRRFMVSESIMRIIPDMVSASKVGKYKTHQELDFVVDFKGLDIDNTQREITACVLQNGRWDNAITGLKPLFTKGDNMLFDYQDKITFPAGKEFRYLDIRTFRYNREGIADILRMDTYWDVVAQKEESRAYQNFQTYNDINGNFVIESLDDNDADLKGDYAKVLFAAGIGQELLDTDVYVVGAMTDWELKKEFKMVYNPAVGSYVTQPFLKQGYYNYYYATVPAGEKSMNFEEFEGNWHQTENSYTILVYYRPFGARHDRLAAVRTIDSNAQ
ncbi:MAG: hypothetical protein ACI8P3_000948 [Saprospiraceae bacterium]|jgi:hypothetical protein